MSTSYNTIYTSFLSKIVDFDLPELTDDELKTYCNRFMESAIIKLPEIVNDLSEREVLEPEIITEVEPTEEEEPTVETPEEPEENGGEQTETIEKTTYVLYLDESAYGRFTYTVPDLKKLVANESSFTLFIRVSNFIKLITFTRGTTETKDCVIHNNFSCTIAYDGVDQLVFSNLSSNAVNYKLLYITYDTPNTEPVEEPVVDPTPITINDEMQNVIDNEGVIEAEEVFTADLTGLEIEIIASQMVVEWINNELNNTQLTRMFVGTKDESMSSQANHIEKLTTLKEKRRADVSMMIRDYAYREWVKEAVQ